MLVAEWENFVESPLGAEWYSMLARHSAVRLVEGFVPLKRLWLLGLQHINLTVPYHITGGSGQCHQRFFLEKFAHRHVSAWDCLFQASHLPFSRYFSWVTWHKFLASGVPNKSQPTLSGIRWLVGTCFSIHLHWTISWINASEGTYWHPKWGLSRRSFLIDCWIAIDSR